MKIIEKNVNVETGEETITERDETPVETKERLDYAAEISAIKAAAEAKANARTAILDRLGITAEEAAILLG